MVFFSYEGGFMRALTRIANMMIVSFFFLLGCVPVVTILPSCAAVYHTTVKVLRGSGSGVIRDFFTAWKDNLRQGIPLTLLALMSGGILVFCLRFGYQNAAHSWVLAYFVIGCLMALMWGFVILWVGPVLSRFRGSLGTMLRLALYFAMSHPVADVILLSLLTIVIVLMDFNPLLTLILPAVFVDLAAGPMEKAFAAFQKSRDLTTDEEPLNEDELPQARELTALEQARALDEN